MSAASDSKIVTVNGQQVINVWIDGGWTVSTNADRLRLILNLSQHD